jgi:AraC-like DNA-binding protein
MLAGFRQSRQGFGSTMPYPNASATTSPLQGFLRCNQQLAQYLDGSPPFQLCGIRWFLQRFYYCCVTDGHYCVPMQAHDWLETSFVCEGRVKFSTPKHATVMGCGDVLVMPPGQQHSWSTRQAPVVLGGFQLKVTPIDKAGETLLAAMAEEAARGKIKLARCAAFARVRAAIWEMASATNASPLIVEKIRSQVQIFVQEMLERAVPAMVLAAPISAPTVDAVELSTTKYQQILKFVHNNINQPLQLEDIAAHFKYSTRHVARLFRQESGVTIGRYILEQKLRAAQRLLATTDYPVKTIAHELGYHDVGYFCRLFRTHLTSTPTSYRTQVLEGCFPNYASPNGHHSYRGDFQAGVGAVLTHCRAI